VKLVFMASLRDDYPLEHPDGTKDAFCQRMELLLGTSPLTTEVFDRWWLIDRYVHERITVEDVVSSVDASVLTLLEAPQYPGVQKRIRALMEQKSGGDQRHYGPRLP
jgi:hypothetical protein